MFYDDQFIYIPGQRVNHPQEPTGNPVLARNGRSCGHCSCMARTWKVKFSSPQPPVLDFGPAIGTGGNPFDPTNWSGVVDFMDLDGLDGTFILDRSMVNGIFDFLGASHFVLGDLPCMYVSMIRQKHTKYDLALDSNNHVIGTRVPATDGPVTWNPAGWMMGYGIIWSSGLGGSTFGAYNWTLFGQLEDTNLGAGGYVVYIEKNYVDDALNGNVWNCNGPNTFIKWQRVGNAGGNPAVPPGYPDEVIVTPCRP